MMKLRTAHLLTGFLLWILFPVFLAAAELPAYKKYEGPIKPGVVITKANFDAYLPELQKLLSPSMLKWFSMGIKNGLITLPVAKTTYTPPSKGQIEATRKYAGAARVGADNQLLNWTAGIPFPEPKNALEIAWNCYPSSGRATGHDDTEYIAWFGLFKGSKYEKCFEWESFNRKYRGRTDIAPLGDMPEFKERGVSFKSSLLVKAPDDVKGFIQLRTRYWDIDKSDESYAYIPAIRRVRRLMGGDLTDPMLGSDAVFDDFEVWRQKLDSKMKMRVLEHRDFLVAKFYGKKPAYDYRKTGPCYQVEWEIKPLWVVEIMTNNPNYLYSKRVIYVDAATPLDQGGRYTLFMGEQYDQKGRLWKSCFYTALAANKERIGMLFGTIYMNYLTDHYTVMDFTMPWLDDFAKTFPLKEDESFSIRGLLRTVR